MGPERPQAQRHHMHNTLPRMAPCMSAQMPPNWPLGARRSGQLGGTRTDMRHMNRHASNMRGDCGATNSTACGPTCEETCEASCCSCTAVALGAPLAPGKHMGYTLPCIFLRENHPDSSSPQPNRGPWSP